ncbi:MAG: heat-inducible transcription repressor HrcA [Anaerolineae bacterium]|nr:heat-inducible transcription repressor HrcA [Anaerolineae bacterium]
MSELTPRQQTILGLVVREYVHTAKPVGSRVLVDKYGLNVSPATVRNEMAYLEEMGYFSHPHTSAGRVPTDQGYRYFVERMLHTNELPLAEQRTIAHQFQQVRQQVDEWMPLAASVLARTTRSAALVTAPKAPYARYRFLQLISTRGRSVLLILVLQGGLIRQQMLTLPESMEQMDLSEAADRLNQLCAGLNGDEVRARIPALPLFEAEVARLVAELMLQGEASVTGEVYHDGLSTLLQEPEFTEGMPTQGVLRVLEEKNFLDAVLVDALGPTVGSVRVMIGEEGRFDELRACSLVLSRYGVSGLATGALGVLGPTRMGYGRVISTVRFVTDLLSDLVHEAFAPEGTHLPPITPRRS